MSKIDLVRGEPSLLELFRALRSSSEAQRTLLLFSRFARDLSNLSKSSKSFYLFDLFRFVVFLPRLGHSYISVACRREIFQIFPNHPNLFICSICSDLLDFCPVWGTPIFQSPIGEKSFKSFQIIQIFLFVRFVQICRISAPQGALLFFPFRHNVPMLVELVLWMFLVAMTDIRFCFPTCLERLDEVVAVIAHLVTPHFVNGSHHLLIWSQR